MEVSILQLTPAQQEHHSS